MPAAVAGHSVIVDFDPKNLPSTSSRCRAESPIRHIEIPVRAYTTAADEYGAVLPTAIRHLITHLCVS